MTFSKGRPLSAEQQKEYDLNRARFWSMDRRTLHNMLRVFEDLSAAEQVDLVSFVGELRTCLSFYHVLVDQLLNGQIGDVYSEDRLYTLLGFDFSYQFDGQNAGHVQRFAESRREMVEAILGDYFKVQFLKDVSSYLAERVADPEVHADCIAFFRMVPGKLIERAFESCAMLALKTGWPIERPILAWKQVLDRDLARPKDSQSSITGVTS